MGKKFIKSFSFRLSLHFMLLLTVAVILVSVLFVFIVNNFAKQNLSDELSQAVSDITLTVNTGAEDESAFKSIQYFISFVVYERDAKKRTFSNDPFIPLLSDSKGKTKRFFSEEYFYDGSLDILYQAKDFYYSGRYYTAVAAIYMDKDTSSKIVNSLPKAVSLISVPILFICFLFSLWITHNTIAPVIKITKSAENFSLSDTETSQLLLPVSGRGDEIDQLSKTFNELFKRLKRDFDRERQFSSDVSHELNTPLTVIYGQAKLLLRWGKEDPEQLDKSLESIYSECKSMHAIISNLLQISRIESGRIKPNRMNVKLKSLFNRLANEVKSYSSSTEVLVKCGDIELETDSEMLHQILTVLISNSVKFADKKCIIELRAKELPDGKILIEEEDNGPGLQEKDLPHVFQRFYRGDEAHTRKAGGSGLGLSIAQTLVSALGGKISARNASSYGAVFSIII